MDNTVYDLIIVGLGAMGSSCFYHASKDPSKKVDNKWKIWY